MFFTVSGHCDKYHIQVSHHMRVGKNALNEYNQYAVLVYFSNTESRRDRHVFCL